MSRRIFLCLVVCSLIGCSKPVVINTRYSRLDTVSKEAANSKITVLIKEVRDNRSDKQIGAYYLSPFSWQKLWDYVSEESVSEIVAKRLADAFRAAGFRVLDKDSAGQSYNLEVTGEILRYFVTVNLAGISSNAEVSLRVKVYETSNDKVLFDNLVSKSRSHTSAMDPEIINEALDMVVAEVVNDLAFFRGQSSLPQAGGVPPVKVDGVIKAGVDIFKYKKMAVLDFASASAASASGKEVADIMSAALMKRGFSIVERSKLNKIMDEHSLSLTGLTDSTGLAKLGKMAGASAIVMGNVSAYECKGEKCRVSLTAKMIDVESGEVIWSGSGSGQGKESPQSYASAILEKITEFR